MSIKSEQLAPKTRDLLGACENHVDGRWVAGEGASFEAINPFTEDVIARIRGGSIAQARAAIAGARRSFDARLWRDKSPKHRSDVLHAITRDLAGARDEFTDLIVTEGGCPISTGRSLNVDSMLESFEWFADAALRGPDGGWERYLPLHKRPTPSRSLLLREPAGVVVGITPYNVPLIGAAWKIGGALASGCSSILMPSPRAMLSAIAFMRVLDRAGLPKGVVSLVLGGPDIGRELTENPMVDMVSFTGSDSVGRQVMEQGAKSLKKVLLELGGKSPNIVLPGTDIAPTVGPSIARFCRNSGQGCACPTRTFVPRGKYDEFVGLAKDYMNQMPVGDPRDEKTLIGPLIRGEHRARVEGFVERAVASGGRVVAGGGRPPQFSRGYFMNPTFVGDVANRSEIAQEELFGPVGVVIPYDSLADAIKMANDTRYALHASLWGPEDTAFEVARNLRSGMVSINGGGGVRADAPWGGPGSSGIGREAGEEGFLEFFETKHIQWSVR